MINWKVRFKNPVYVLQIIIAALSPVLVYAGLSFADLTTWSSIGDLFKEAYSNPALLGAMIYAGYTATIDPVTKGHADSTRALRYEEPQ